MSKGNRERKRIKIFCLGVLACMIMTGCSGQENVITTSIQYDESTKTDTSIESAAGREEDLVVVVSSGDHVQVCWEMLELDAWVHIDPDTKGLHATMESGVELEFVIEDGAVTPQEITYEVSKQFTPNIINKLRGKKVGEVITYQEEIEGRKYVHTFTVTGINDVQIPSYCMPEDWGYQLEVSRVGNFFLANGMEADNGPHYGFVDKVTKTGPIWGDNLVKYYSKVNASSILIPQVQGQFVYSPSHTAMNDRSLTWSEGVDGYGITECVEIKQMYLGQEADVLTFNELCIVNGYAENEKKWSENNRVKSMNLYYCDQLMGLITLEDTMNPQYIDLTPLQMKVGNGREAVFHFRIAEVYEGTKYDDTCITGIEIGFSVDE